MNPKYLASLVLTGVIACAHQPARPQTDLAASLRLVHPSVGQLAIGTTVEIGSFLQNITAAPVEVCLQEGLVSVWLEDTHGALMWPIQLGGTMLDAECAQRRVLAPGEQIAFVARGGIARVLPPGPAVLRFGIGVSSSTQRQPIRIQAAEPIQLIAR